MFPEEPRYWVLDFDERDHKADLLASIEKGEVECIVDEEAGGIIAYVLNGPGEHRGELVVAALTVQDEG